MLDMRLHYKPSRDQCATNSIEPSIHPKILLARGSNDQNRHGDGLLDPTNASAEQQYFRMRHAQLRHTDLRGLMDCCLI